MFLLIYTVLFSLYFLFALIIYIFFLFIFPSYSFLFTVCMWYSFAYFFPLCVSSLCTVRFYRCISFSPIFPFHIIPFVHISSCCIFPSLHHHSTHFPSLDRVSCRTSSHFKSILSTQFSFMIRIFPSAHSSFLMHVFPPLSLAPFLFFPRSSIPSIPSRPWTSPGSLCGKGRSKPSPSSALRTCWLTDWLAVLIGWLVGWREFVYTCFKLSHRFLYPSTYWRCIFFFPVFLYVTIILQCPR